MNQPVKLSRSRCAGSTSCSKRSLWKTTSVPTLGSTSRCPWPRCSLNAPPSCARPGVIQVQRAGQRAAIVGRETVEVAAIERTGRIHREVAFEVEEAELQLAVERQAQRLEPLEAAALSGRGAGRLEPRDVIAAHVGEHAAPWSGPDAGLAQHARVPLRTQLLGERARLGERNKVMGLAPALLGDRIRDGLRAHSQRIIPISKGWVSSSCQG